MNSNMLAGERRWATARRGGMTVLGKVAVPKPLNLPSQRLENNGLDPSVEIVPKGTLSWGSRPSSSGSNPWISSSLSPNADGGTVSPSHVSGRPSSGGSGTRPSTAGSDRTHEPVAGAWGPNSRPSSASGTLSSNQTSSTALRPRSAENRPNSSQLSRFAEPGSKSSAAWGPHAERLGAKSSKEDMFSLSSGDFPTLGAEKDHSVKNIELEDHGRPSSASGRIALEKENIKYQADVMHGTVNTWRADGSQNAEDDIHPSMEKRHGDHHQYYNANAGPQHFDSWRGPPMNGPAGGWYGGRPRGPPFGGPVAPGGFPMEPYPYYRPQMPPPPLAGSQPVPPQGPRGGPHPKNGDLYRPQMPDAYARPGMPFRPGFYPGPPGPHGPPGPMAFEGYYGPPMGYCNNERDIPFMGVGGGPPVYNGYPAPAPAADISNSHGGRGAGRGPASKTLSEHAEADHLEDNTQGPKRGLLRNHNEGQRVEGENREHNVQPNVLFSGKGRLPTIPYRKNEWGAEEVTEEAVVPQRRTPPTDNFSRGYENRAHSTDSVKVKSFEGVRNVKGVEDNLANKSGIVQSFPPELPQIPPVSERDTTLNAAAKKTALMQKIDGLNAKIRVTDGRNDSSGAYNKEEERRGSQIAGEVSDATRTVDRTLLPRDYVSVPQEMNVPIADKPMQQMSVMSRRPYNGEQGRDNRGKGKFNSQDADGWRRKPTNIDSAAPNINAHGPNVAVEASENSMINPAGKIEGDLIETNDSIDIQAQQRAKMRELAKQRALQLQKEEEERIREQKAKALAKLEELNRRSLAGEAANKNSEKTEAVSDIRVEQKEPQTVCEPVKADLEFQEPGWNMDVASVDTGGSTNQTGESVQVSKNLPLEKKHEGSLESNVSPLPVHEDARADSGKKVVAQFHDGGISRPKRTGYKQKQNNLVQKSSSELSAPHVASEAQKNHTYADIPPHDGPSGEIKMTESNVPNVSSTAVEPSAHQRKKHNRNSKNKHKLDETTAVPALPSVTSDVDSGKQSVKNGESKDSLSNLDSSVSTVAEPDRGTPSQDVGSSLPNEDSQTKGSNQWKPHPSRRLPRNQHANRFTDKHHGGDTVVWAPVRSDNKAKGSVDASQKSTQESDNSVKGDNAAAEISSKGKRAEMERYVPKPVAKELAQQGNSQPLTSSISSSRPNEAAEREQYVISMAAHVGSTVEINEGDVSHNKHKKEQGTWKQRGGSTDSSHVKGGAHVEPSPKSEPTKDVKQSKDFVHLVKTEIDDGHNMPKSTSKYPSVKDQGAINRGKRHPSRGGHRGTGNNPDAENTSSGEIDGSNIQSAGPDKIQTDRTFISKENRNFVGERSSSHWQPKSNSNNANNNQHVNRNAGTESVTTEANRFPKKDHPQHKVHVSQTQPGHHYANVKSNVTEESTLGNQQEFNNREKKPAPAKSRPYSPNQDPVGSGDSPPNSNTDDQQLDRNMPSGSRRNNVRPQNRSVRGGHDPRGDWSSSGYDNRPHNAPTFRDNRQRQNMHYEYHPVGPVKGNNKTEKVEEAVDGAEGMEQRHRERGQSQSQPKRGGNFYRRQTGPAHVDSSRN
ncbi:hypothetical protein ABFS83_04G173700 [Erythranthe nasuta]